MSRMGFPPYQSYYSVRMMSPDRSQTVVSYPYRSFVSTIFPSWSRTITLRSAAELNIGSKPKIIQIITIFISYIQEMCSILIKTISRAGGAFVYVKGGVGVLVIPALGIVGFVVEPRSGLGWKILQRREPDTGLT